jgi:hypothetical protein
MAGKASEEIYDWIIKNVQTYKCPASGGFDSHIFGKDEAKGDGAESDKQGRNDSPFFQPGPTPVDVPRVVKDINAPVSKLTT